MRSDTIAVGSETVQVRRITWAEFWKIRPDLRPANDNEVVAGAAISSIFAEKTMALR